MIAKRLLPLALVFGFLGCDDGGGSAAAPSTETAVASSSIEAPSRLLVMFRDDSDEAQRSAALSGSCGDVRGYEPSILGHLYAAAPRNGLTTAQAINALKSDPAVLFAEPDGIASASLVPNDPSYPAQWALPKINAPAAWDITTGSASVIVAVIDSGIDYTHPDLAANLWTNPGEIPANGVDDDGNGYVDDVRGYDWVNHDADPMDDFFHGTHVSGTIGAVGNNALGVAGLAWTVKIMPLKFLDGQGNGSYADAIFAIQYAIQKGARVLNNSWGGTAYSQALQNAITTATSAGILVVAAAGNDNTNAVHYPSGMNGVISVAATDALDQKAVFSNFGPTIDVSAPGVGIASTMPTFATPFMAANNYPLNYAAANGTSMACPHVSALAVLLVAKKPGASNTRVELCIERTAVDLGAPGWDPIFGWGRLDAGKAVNRF